MLLIKQSQTAAYSTVSKCCVLNNLKVLRITQSQSAAYSTVSKCCVFLQSPTEYWGTLPQRTLSAAQKSLTKNTTNSDLYEAYFANKATLALTLSMCFCLFVSSDPISAVMVMEVGEPPILNWTFTLSCNVTGPVDSVHWMMNGSYLHSDERRSLSEGNMTLTFSPVRHSDDGSYQCSAFNAVSNRTSSGFSLRVNCKYPETWWITLQVDVLSVLLWTTAANTKGMKEYSQRWWKDISSQNEDCCTQLLHNKTFREKWISTTLREIRVWFVFLFIS